MMLRRGKIKILFILAILPFYYANECLETVQEVCKDVIDENNDQLLVTVEEMIANGTTSDAPETSNDFMTEIMSELRTELKEVIREEFKEIFNATQCSPSDSVVKRHTDLSSDVVPQMNVQSGQSPNQLWKQLTKLAKSCDDILSVGINESGEYQVDPDGATLGQEAISVYCDFQTNSTTISRNTGRVEMFNNGSEHVTLNIDYDNANVEQLVRIVEYSDRCQQEIVFSCYITSSFFMKNGESFAKWNYRSGGNQPISYNHFGCNCGMYYKLCTYLGKAL